MRPCPIEAGDRPSIPITEAASPYSRIGLPTPLGRSCLVAVLLGIRTRTRNYRAVFPTGQVELLDLGIVVGGAIWASLLIAI